MVGDMGTMSIQQWMSVLYLVLFVLAAIYAVNKFVFWYTTRRTRVAFMDAVFFLIETIVLALLTLTTGGNPLFDIETYRPLVVLARLAMAICLVFCIRFTRVMIHQQGTEKATVK